MLKFGILADIQYAPIDDGYSFSGTPRYYRHSLSTAGVAASHFQSENVDFAINIGDTIDGKCAETASKALGEVCDKLLEYKGEWYGVIGNHELYNFGRERWGGSISDVGDKQGINCEVKEEEGSGELVGYYSFDRGDFRFVVLDCYDITSLDRPVSTSAKGREAKIILDINPNDDKNSPVGLKDDERRYVAFNGAIGTIQMDWIRKTLEDSQRNSLNVIIISHVPFYPPVAPNATTLCWNYSDVLSLLGEFDCVKVCCSGHTHKSTHERDPESGIQHFVFAAALESPPPIHTYAMITLSKECIEVQGYGDEEGRTGKYELK